MEYELAIIGGGPAATGAAVYAGRKQLKAVVIAEEIGGQSAVSETIYNWIGTKAIGGGTLAQSLREHIEEYTGDKGTLTLSVGVRVTKVAKEDTVFILTLNDGTTLRARAVLIATGSRHRKLDVPGAEALDHKGIMYCATCDGPLFGDMDVAVIGGGNAAVEAALQLAQYAHAVTLIHRSESFKADPITLDAAKANSKISIVTNAILTEIRGGQFVEGLTYTVDRASHELPVSGIFVEIGQLPNTELVDGLVAKDALGRAIVDPRTQRTDILGIWAAGDCTDGRYHQNNIAVGDAVKALEDIYIWLKTSK